MTAHHRFGVASVDSLRLETLGLMDAACAVVHRAISLASHIAFASGGCASVWARLQGVKVYRSVLVVDLAERSTRVGQPGNALSKNAVISSPSCFKNAPRSKPGGFAATSLSGLGMAMLGESMKAKCQAFGTRCRFAAGRLLATHSGMKPRHQESIELCLVDHGRRPHTGERFRSQQHTCRRHRDDSANALILERRRGSR